MSSNLTEGRGHRRFSSRVAVLVGAVTSAALGLAVSAVFWSARESDRVSVDRQIRVVRHVIDAELGKLAHDQENVVFWDDSVVNLRIEPDPEWVEANLTVYMAEYSGHDRAYILDDRDRPVHAMADGRPAPAAVFEASRAALRPLIDEVRAGRGSGAAPPVEEGEQPGPRHVARMLRLEGGPAIASVMTIVPDTAEVAQEPGTEYLHVAVRLLNDRFARRLGEENLIDAARFSAADDRRPGEESVPLVAEGGEAVGHLLWRPELPGTRILWTLLPVTALAGCGVVAVVASLLRGLHRASVELQAGEAQARQLAFHDALTGLPNRALFADRLDHALARVRREGGRAALLLLDLDRFKEVNDALGHAAGDALIREFAGRLAGLVRATDTVARLGGDEFAVVLGPLEGPADAEALCARVLDAVRQPFEALGSRASVGVSIGVALAPEAGTDRAELQRKADVALYRAKGDGRDRHRLFEPAMDEDARWRREIEGELRLAVETGAGIEVFYQPQVTGEAERVASVEALVRWRHPRLGLVPPARFVPIAEETGLIDALGERVLRRACAAVAGWPGVSVAVNVSPLQFRSGALARKVLDVVRETGIEAQRLELEVTEGTALDDDPALAAQLRTLRGAGVKIAIDDFGTGHSSLSRLRHLEVDRIKIDRSFVQQLGQSASAVAVVRTVVDLGRALGLGVVAEGVETAEQRRILGEAGCRDFQGYLFARPAPEREMAERLAAGRDGRPAPPWASGLPATAGRA